MKTLIRQRRLYFFITCFLLWLPTIRADELRIGVEEGQLPPFSVVDEKGNLSGFNIDIANALCQAMQQNCQLISKSWEALIPALNNGEVDAVVASFSVTEERKTQVDFTHRYYKNGAKFIRPVGDKTAIAYKRLVGKTVGVQAATAIDDFLTDKFEGVNIQRYESADALYQSLTQGHVDLVVADQFEQLAWINENPKFELAGPTYNLSRYFSEVAIAVKQGNHDLRQQLNQAIKTIRDNGQYKKINRRYFPFSIYGR